MALVAAVVAAPAAHDVWQLPWIPAHEGREIRELTTERPLTRLPAQSLVDIWRRAVAATPAAVAVVTSKETLTYREVDMRADKLARWLAEVAGVRRNSLVGLIADRCAAMMVGIIGILKAGGAYVPMEPDNPAQRTAEIVEDSGMVTLVCQAGKDKSLSTVKSLDVVWLSEDGCEVLSSDSGSVDMRGADANAWCPPDVCGSDLCYLLYTSGSTGRPKGVLIHHGGVTQTVAASIDTYALSPSDRALLISSFTFDASVALMWISFATGGSVALAPVHEILDSLPGVMRRMRCTWLDSVPTLLSLQSAEELERAGVTLVVAGGEAINEDLIARLSGRIRMINAYGPTEVSIQSTLIECSVSMKRPRSIGRPLAGLRCYIVDRRSGALLPVGVAGELCIAGGQVGLGYHNRPLETSRSFVANPFVLNDDDDKAESDRAKFSRMYRTGDLCRWLPDGSIEFMGRIDQQVKLRGYRIELGEIASRLREVSGVVDAVCVLRQDRLVAYVVPVGADVAACKDHMRKSLPAYMVPSAIVPLDSFPVSTSGKLDARALPDPISIARNNPGQGSGAADSHPSLAEDRTQRILEICRGLLRDPELRVDDNLFERGLNSLIAISLTASLRRAGLGTWSVSEVLQLRRPSVKALLAVYGSRADEASPASPSTTGRPFRIRDEGRIRGLGRALHGFPVPCSLQQEQMFVLQLADPTSSAYNVHVCTAFHSGLRLDLLKQSLMAMTKRHDSLRTHFVQIQHDSSAFSRDQFHVMQVVAPVDEAKLRLDEEECSSVAEAERAVQARASTPFDMGRAPLMDILICKVAGSQTVYVSISMHHAITDGESIVLLERELSQCYNALLSGVDPESVLPATDLQYADFAIWQRRELLNLTRTAALEAYWIRALGDAPVLSLPTDRPRPAVPSSTADVVSFRIDAPLVSALSKLCVRHGCTLFHGLMTLYGLLLCKMGTEEEGQVVVGFPYANRSGTDGLEAVQGYFVNTLPVVIRGRGTLASMLECVRGAVLGAIENADLPFSRIVSALNVPRESGRSPLVQTMFSLIEDRMSQSSLVLDGTEAVPVFGKAKHAQMEIYVVLYMGEHGELIGDVTFMTDLFDRDTAKRLAERYVALVAAVVAAPAAHDVWQLPWIPAHEGREIRELTTERPLTRLPAQSLVDIWRRAVAATPAAVAVVTSKETLTYREVDMRADKLARWLAEVAGVRRNSLVGLIADRCAAMMVGIIGILKAGGAYVPMEPDNPAQRTAEIVEDSGMVTLVCQAGKDKSLSTVKSLDVVWLSEDGCEVLSSDSGSVDMRGADANAWCPPDVCGSDLCYLLYTSGSTGRPKGVLIHHGGVTQTVAASIDTYALSPSDRALLISSFTFDASVALMWISFATGGSVALAPVHEILDSLPGVMRRMRCTWLDSVPTLLSLQSAEELERAGVTLVVAGGEAINEDLIARLSGRIRMINAYGPTEVSIQSTLIECSVSMKRPRSIGRPLAGLRCYIVDRRSGALLPVGVAGELCIAGGQVGLGYHNRPLETSRSFVANPFVLNDDDDKAESDRAKFSRMYRTGDLCRWLPDGSIEFMGRIDQQVKLRGYRIELGEIASRLREVSGVVDAVCVLRQDRLVAYVVPVGADVAACKDHMRKSLPAYMVPSAIVPLDSFPVSTSGKLDARALPDPISIARNNPGQGSGAADSHPSLAEDRTQRILEICRGLLRDPELRVDDNLFERGLNSLIAISLTASLRRAGLGTWSVGDILMHQSVFLLCSMNNRPSAPFQASQDPDSRTIVFAQANDASGSTTVTDASSQEVKPVSEITYRQDSGGNMLIQALAVAVQFLFAELCAIPLMSLVYISSRDKGPADIVLYAVLGFFLYLFTLFFGVLCCKWMLIGKQTPGEVQLWSWRYLRWWFVQNLLDMVDSMFMHRLHGTPLLCWWYRALGARIGKNVLLWTSKIHDHDLICLGDNIFAYDDSILNPHIVMNGKLVFSTLTIGSDVIIGQGACVGPENCCNRPIIVPSKSILPPLSFFGENSTITSFQNFQPPPEYGRPRISLYSRLLVFIFAEMTEVISLVPAIICIDYMSNTESTLVLLICDVLLGGIISLFTTLILFASVLRLAQGLMHLYPQYHSAAAYLVLMLSSRLTSDMVSISLFESTPLISWYLRLLGAKIGRRCRLTFPKGVSDFSKLHFGDDVFTGSNLHVVTNVNYSNRSRVIHIGNNVVITNSVVILEGVEISDDCMIGDMTLVDASQRYEPGYAYVGSTKFARYFPKQVQSESSFKKLLSVLRVFAIILGRLCIIFLILVPWLILKVISDSIENPYHAAFFYPVWTRLMDADADLQAQGQSMKGHYYAGLFMPMAVWSLAFMSCVAVFCFKWLAIRSFPVNVKFSFQSSFFERWCVFGILLSMSNGLILHYLRGTEWICVFMRCLGTKVSTNVFFWTQPPAEMDLYSFEDGTVISSYCVLQGHIVNTGMLEFRNTSLQKFSTLHTGASVLCGSTVCTQSSVMPRSLVLSGEMVEPHSAWRGCPARIFEAA